jgi:hypothetical protein
LKEGILAAGDHQVNDRVPLTFDAERAIYDALHQNLGAYRLSKYHPGRRFAYEHHDHVRDGFLSWPWMGRKEVS